MGLFQQFSSILEQYKGGSQPGNAEDAMQHYQQVARAAEPSELSGGWRRFSIRRGRTFGQNIASMFGQSNPNQRAGILNTLLASGGSGVLSRLGLGSTVSQVTPEQAQQIPPQAVELAAEHAEEKDPSVVERASQFYSQHPQLVQAFGCRGGVTGVAPSITRVTKGGPALDRAAFSLLLLDV
jgi:hypothetical protein